MRSPRAGARDAERQRVAAEVGVVDGDLQLGAVHALPRDPVDAADSVPIVRRVGVASPGLGRVVGIVRSAEKADSSASLAQAVRSRRAVRVTSPAARSVERRIASTLTGRVVGRGAVEQPFPQGDARVDDRGGVRARRSAGATARTRSR